MKIARSRVLLYHHDTAQGAGTAEREGNSRNSARPHLLPRLRSSDRPLRAWLTILWALDRPLRALCRGKEATLSWEAPASEVRSIAAAPCAGPAARRAAGTMMDECCTTGEQHATKLRCRQLAFCRGRCRGALQC